jgi:hypothetical protein
MPVYELTIESLKENKEDLSKLGIKHYVQKTASMENTTLLRMINDILHLG